MSEFRFPTEVIELPSKGLVYPESSPLSSGTIELKYMSAKEEDILTNSNFIEKGLVIDKLLQSLIITKIDYDELILGDKNAILFAARILGYGANYDVVITDKHNQKVNATIDLSKLENKIVDETLFASRSNDFSFTLPHTDNEISFKLLTHGDEKKIEGEIKGLQKINPTLSYDMTTRLKYMITSVNGNRELKAIRDFVDNYLIAKDARALREYYSKIQPDVNLKFIPEDDSYAGEGIDIPISLNFFWPDAGI